MNITASASAKDAALYDARLVNCFNRGDESAFTEIVKRYWDDMYGVAYRLLRHKEDSEEVASDAFIRAYRGLARFRGDSSLRTWLHNITLNLARNRYWFWYRRCRHLQIGLDAPMRSDGTNDLTLQDILPSENINPADATELDEFSGRIAQGMDKLGPKHREILVLRNIKNMSYEEIAEILGVNVGTVKSRIARARENLRSFGSDYNNRAAA